MHPKTTQDVLDLIGSGLASAALGAALELGLFWRFVGGPRAAASVSDELGIPAPHCDHWLRFLAALGLLQGDGEEYALSPAARTAILDAHSRDTWKMLAVDARENQSAGLSLARRLGAPIADGPLPNEGTALPAYVRAMNEDLSRARLFTRMLFELHGALAEEIAETLDLRASRRLLDLGGGSGVVSLALLRRHPRLTAIVVDLPNVCAAGREIIDAFPERDRLAFHPADLLRDALPAGCDAVLQCDLGRIDDRLLSRASALLREGDRFVLIDQWFDLGDEETPERMAFLLSASLDDPRFALWKTEEVAAKLAAVGLRVLSFQLLSRPGWKMVVAEKSGRSRSRDSARNASPARRPDAGPRNRRP